MGRNRPDVRRGERLLWQSTLPDAIFPVVGARRLAGEREEGRRKHDDATINLRANDERVIVRVIDERADASERQPGCQWHG